jgi:hypothetical protein
MSVKAKTILKDRFWILEDKGQRVGTLSINENNKYVVSSPSSGISQFNNKKALQKTFGKEFFEANITNITTPTTKDVNGYPTSTVPYNEMFDVKRNLPLFTKSEKSKSIYCAGYYVIRFDKGWVKSFCPKLITLERYGYNGPFKTEIEMRSELSRVK